MIFFILFFLLGAGLLALIILRGDDEDIFPTGGPSRRLLLKIAVGLVILGLVGGMALVSGMDLLLVAVAALAPALLAGHFAGGALASFLTRLEQEDDRLYTYGEDEDGEEHGA